MRTDTHIGFVDLVIFLGVFQGLFLAWFYIKSGRKESKANLYQGLLMLFLSLCIFEELLNNTGYIVKYLFLSDYSEFLNFTFGPLFYLYVRSSLNPEEKKKNWVHFIFATFWFLYMILHHMQSNDFKYNSYLGAKHPDWPFLHVETLMSDDPLYIRRHISEILALHFSTYMVFSIMLLVKKLRSMGQSFFRVHDEQLKSLRNATYHFVIIILIFISVKIYFGNDVGDYFIALYISFMIYATSYQVLDKSKFLNQPHSFLELPKLRYAKSSLTEEGKETLLAKIKTEMETNNYFTNNMASLSDLAKKVHESPHHVSQVINEKTGKSFFEFLALYRVEEAKKLIKNDVERKIIVEELAEMVGYNSKSAFNNAFKRITTKTPSEYREEVNPK